MRATPKTINGAIENALDDFRIDAYPGVALKVLIKRHVKDFLAQKFMVVILKSGFENFDAEKSIQKLFDDVTK